MVFLPGLKSSYLKLKASYFLNKMQICKWIILKYI